MRRQTAYDPAPLMVSIGVAATNDDGAADVMLAADRALSGPKWAGRDRVLRGGTFRSGVSTGRAG